MNLKNFPQLVNGTEATELPPGLEVGFWRVGWPLALGW